MSNLSKKEVPSVVQAAQQMVEGTRHFSTLGVADRRKNAGILLLGIARGYFTPKDIGTTKKELKEWENPTPS